MNVTRKMIDVFELIAAKEEITPRDLALERSGGQPLGHIAQDSAQGYLSKLANSGFLIKRLENRVNYFKLSEMGLKALENQGE